ncbi:DUF4817 domain-containing protein [Trichonephila clavipes]|uniref:DUF4817 domain-containing protein n=1 Tax=Trichonephila clavipes TaxID=2585209 RepID=A0A8X6SWM9_TRICX|nr:DUF4817 domain-containing protein [Trichonephila clavipes]
MEIEFLQQRVLRKPTAKGVGLSDEAHFWLNDYVNKQNCRIWSEANPQVYVETPLHPEKLTVWCALWAGGIIGPYFFKNDEGHNVTVNGDRCRAMITNFFIPELNNHDVQELWFQQDGATCHTARATIDLLKDTFGDRLISRFGPMNWPPRSCDLTPLDYFLWGYVKSLVYTDKPQTLGHLEDNIRRVIADIRPQMLEKSHRKLDYIRASHMPEMIFKILDFDSARNTLKRLCTPADEDKTPENWRKFEGVCLENRKTRKFSFLSLPSKCAKNDFPTVFRRRSERGIGHLSNCPRVNQEDPRYVSVIESKKVCSHQKGSADGNGDVPSRKPSPENSKYCSRVKKKFGMTDHVVCKVTTQSASESYPWCNESVRKDQLVDPEIKPIIELKESTDGGPSRQDMASFHPRMKCYWALSI